MNQSIVVEGQENTYKGKNVLFQGSRDKKSQTQVMTEAEGVIQAAIKHNQWGHEINNHPCQTQQSGYCVLCGRYISSTVGRRICLDCREEIEEWNNEVYAELYCYNCGKPY